MTADRCSNCGQHPAVSKIEITQDGERKELALCPACLKDLFADVGKFLSQPADEGPCPDCGVRWEEVKKTRHLGCPTCWDHFAAEIDQLREKKGPTQPYRGKLPARLGQKSAAQEQREALKADLHAAIVAEEYERAASLRDQLKALGVEP